MSSHRRLARWFSILVGLLIVITPLGMMPIGANAESNNPTYITPFRCAGAPLTFPVSAGGHIGWIYLEPTWGQGVTPDPSGLHSGIDFWAGDGAPVAAVATGYVVSISYFKGGDVGIDIYYPSVELESYTGHIKDPKIGVNDPVVAGMVIAYESGNHVHFSLGVLGYNDQSPLPQTEAQHRDPTPYLAPHGNLNWDHTDEVHQQRSYPQVCGRTPSFNSSTIFVASEEPIADPDHSDLYTMAGQKATYIGSLIWNPVSAGEAVVTDIARSPDGELYGWCGMLCKIDPKTTLVTNVGTSTQNIDALAFSRGNILYGASSDGGLYTIDQSSGALTKVGRMVDPSNGKVFGTSGDIVFGPDGKLYGTGNFGTSVEDTLVTIDPQSAQVTPVGAAANTGFESIWGLYFVGQQLYGTTGLDSTCGDNGSLIRLSASTGVGTKVSCLTFNASGAASEPPSVSTHHQPGGNSGNTNESYYSDIMNWIHNLFHHK